jgi:hypothetical protein
MQRIYQTRSLQGKELCGKKKRPGGRSLAKILRPHAIRAFPWRSLAAVVIMVMIVIAVLAVAPRPHVLQVTTAALRLAAVFTMLAFRIMQSALGVADLLLAPSVIIVIAVHRPRGNGSTQQ